MSDFKVGDKVDVPPPMETRAGTIIAIHKDECCVRWPDGSLGVWPLSKLVKIEPLPTPPEGREVEAEMRYPLVGDTFWRPMGGWIVSEWDYSNDFGGVQCHVLRPLPPKPEGEGWEWRMPVKGDEYQSLNMNGEPEGGVCVYKFIVNLAGVRLGYRWCRARPKVKRFEHYMRISGSIHELAIPMIDTGTGPRLDIDKIGREWAIKWLEGQGKTGYTVSHFVNMLRKELEANNERD